MRAERFDDRTAENVAIASTNVPSAVASEATVVQSIGGQATTRRTLVALIEQHRRACDDFGRVAERVVDWDSPTPCDEWDARALVEHVIGFHDFLLLRPLGVRANRPRGDPAARWRATSDALFTALAAPDVLDRETELPGGGTSTPRTMLAALTTDVLVHTWDLAARRRRRSAPRRGALHRRAGQRRTIAAQPGPRDGRSGAGRAGRRRRGNSTRGVLRPGPALDGTARAVEDFADDRRRDPHHRPSARYRRQDAGVPGRRRLRRRPARVRDVRTGDQRHQVHGVLFDEADRRSRRCGCSSATV